MTLLRDSGADAAEVNKVHPASPQYPRRRSSTPQSERVAGRAGPRVTRRRRRAVVRTGGRDGGTPPPSPLPPY